MPSRLNVVIQAIVMFAALATVPVVILGEQRQPPAWVPIADWLIWITFAGAIGAALWYSENRIQYLRRNPLELAVVILSFPLLPSLLALTRLVRLFRVARVVRLTRLAAIGARVIPALRATMGRSEVLYAFSVSSTLVMIAAVMIVLLEPETVQHSFANALWWSTVTVTTVGYGDITPVTLPGRLVAIVVMLAGLGVISTLSASIAAYFVDQGQKPELHEIDERLARIEALLRQEHKGPKNPL